MLASFQKENDGDDFHFINCFHSRFIISDFDVVLWLVVEVKCYDKPGKTVVSGDSA